MAVFLILATFKNKYASQKEGEGQGTPEQTSYIPRDTPHPLLSREEQSDDDDDDDNDDEDNSGCGP